MKKIYVGCAIAGAPEGWLEKITEFKEKIRKEFGCEVMEFVPPDKGTAEHVYQNDIHHAVASCDCMVAEVSYPSLGLGYELATMIEKLRKPVLLCAQEGMFISRVIQGAAGPENPNCKFIFYKDLNELLPKIKELLATLPE